MKMKREIYPIMLLVSFLAGCTAEATPTVMASPSATAAIFLPPYATRTPSAISESTAAIPTVDLPSPTATPLSHTVKKGEDFGGIAYQYGITVNALTAANPDVNPNLMSIGTVLVIPAGGSPSEVSSPQAQLPTPPAILVSAPNCFNTADGRLDCYAEAYNPLDIFMESVTVVFRLLNRDSGETLSLESTTPLNLLPPGWSQPVHVIFPAPLPPLYQTGVELASALPYTISDQRYINIQIKNYQETYQPDRLTAKLEGDLILEGDSGSQANSTWVSATAFDSNNRVVGFRRWESTSPLTGGVPVHFQVWVYSAGPVIDHVTLLAEARR